jgi:hypothetical protein
MRQAAARRGVEARDPEICSCVASPGNHRIVSRGLSLLICNQCRRAVLGDPIPDAVTLTLLRLAFASACVAQLRAELQDLREEHVPEPASPRARQSLRLIEPERQA